MTSYFYMVVEEAVLNGWEEQMAEFYALKLTDMRRWCEELLDLNGIPECPFRTCLLREMFSGYSEEPFELYNYIQRECAPEEEEDEALEGCEEPWPEVHKSTAGS